MNEKVKLVRMWIEDIVIGLNFCPFAKPVFDKEKIRYALSEDKDPTKILKFLDEELGFLHEKPKSELSTSILILPAFKNFDDFLDHLALMDDYLDQTKYRGIFQLASFHPDYLFAEEEPESLSHYTNRSPYAIVHIIREEEIDVAVKFYKEVDSIPEVNKKTIEALGEEKLKKLLSKFR